MWVLYRRKEILELYAQLLGSCLKRGGAPRNKGIPNWWLASWELPGKQTNIWIHNSTGIIFIPHRVLHAVSVSLCPSSLPCATTNNKQTPESNCAGKTPQESSKLASLEQGFLAETVYGMRQSHLFRPPIKEQWLSQPPRVRVKFKKMLTEQCQTLSKSIGKVHSYE